MPSSTSSNRRLPGLTAAVAVAVSVLALLSGCVLLPAANRPSITPSPPASDAAASAPSPATPLPGPSSVPPTTSAPPTSSAGTATPSPAGGTDLTTSFARFAANQPGELALAVTAVGGSAPPQTFGQLDRPVAWSTSKVPIAIAVERTDRASELRPTMRQAITASSNEAAETLWQSLGTPSQAAAATDKVLRDYGDSHTRTQSERVRPPYTAFGQTRWALADQARFAASLPCRSEAAPVYAAMGQVVPDQRWGLGIFQSAHFKGGWGPAAAGSGYLVRQFGVIPTPQGQVAVTMAVESSSFEQGTATLTQTAQWLRRNAEDLPTGRC